MNIILTEKKENIIDNTKSYKIITLEEIKKIETLEYDKIIILLCGSFTINNVLPNNSSSFSLLTIKSDYNNKIIEPLCFPMFGKKTFDFCYKIFEEDFITKYFNYLEEEEEISLKKEINLEIKSLKDLKKMADIIISNEDKSGYSGILVDSRRIFALLNFIIKDDDLLFESFEYLYHDFFKDRPFFKELKRKSNIDPLPFSSISFSSDVLVKLYNKYNFILDIDFDKEGEFFNKIILKEKEKKELWESQ